MGLRNSSRSCPRKAGRLRLQSGQPLLSLTLWSLMKSASFLCLSPPSSIMEPCANLPGSCSIQKALLLFVSAHVRVCAQKERAEHVHLRRVSVWSGTIKGSRSGRLRGVKRGAKTGQNRRSRGRRKKWKETRAEDEALVMERSGGGKVSRRRGILLGLGNLGHNKCLAAEGAGTHGKVGPHLEIRA